MRRPCLLAVRGKIIPLLDIVSAFPPSQRWLIEGDMTDQIEWGEVLSDFFRQFVQHHALFLKFGNDRQLLSGPRPFLLEGVFLANLRLNVPSGLSKAGI
jgi:hypothetical protein